MHFEPIFFVWVFPPSTRYWATSPLMNVPRAIFAAHADMCTLLVLPIQRAQISFHNCHIPFIGTQKRRTELSHRHCVNSKTLMGCCGPP